MSFINTDGAANVPITCRSGKTFSIAAAFTNDDASPMVLTGCKFDLLIKQNGTTIDLTYDILIAANVATLRTLITLSKGAYSYEFNITKADKTAIGITYGSFTVNGL